MAWYYSVNGKAEGPVSQEFLIDGLRAGRLTLVDLAFKEGSQAWCTLGEFSEFREVYSNPLPMPTPAPAAPAEPTPKSAERRKAPSPPAEEQGPHRASWEYAPAWVVLKQKEKNFEQLGPYTEKQIVDLIGSGEVQYSQYVWKPGYKRWVRIGNLPEFDRRKRDREGDSVNQIIPLPKADSGFPILTREELLGAIERLHPKTLAPHETRPPEAVGKDLTEKSAGDEATRVSAADATRISMSEPTRVSVPDPTRISTFSLGPKTSPSKPKFDESTRTHIELPDDKQMLKSEAEVDPEATSINAVPDSSFRRNVVRALVSTGAAFLIVVVALQWYSKRTRVVEPPTADSELEPVSQPVARQPRPDPKPIAPPVAASTPIQRYVPPPAPTAAPQVQQPVANATPFRPATEISIVPLRLSTSTPALAFQSDVAVGDVISVAIEGKTGDVLQYPSYYSEHEIRRASGEIATMDLSKIRLPKGTYRIRARAGAAQSEILVFVGLRDDEFERAREKHLKMIAGQQQTERKAMYYGAQRLEVLTREINENYKKLRRDPKGWSKYFATWKNEAKEASRPVGAILGQARANELAFRNELKDFQSTTEKLAALARQLDSAVHQKRDVAGVPESEILRDFSRIRQQAARLSGR